jgi:phospholipid/cholesterol/gamma-HCH transport system permease protein
MTMIPAGDRSLSIRLIGRLDAFSTGSIWREAVDGVKARGWEDVVVEADGLDYIDGTGIGLLVQLRTIQTERGNRIDIKGLRPEFKRLLDMFDPSFFTNIPPENTEKKRFLEKIGYASAELFSDMKRLVSFVGEIFSALSFAFKKPSQIRWKDVYLVSEKAGIDALPIIILIGFLMGLIMSFQSAVTLERFGAELFVANLLGLSMFRELGPLMTSILFASRSGSAFAAEIGTMKVNDELKALSTMGINPVSFLAVPRVIAALSMTPLLTLFFIFSSLIGGAVVMLFMGYPDRIYIKGFFIHKYY